MDTDVLQSVYNVYCRNTGMLLATVDGLDALDQIPYCDYCDSDHDPADLKVEIAFRPKSGSSMIMAA
jgi:hypothetical protein